MEGFKILDKLLRLQFERVVQVLVLLNQEAILQLLSFELDLLKSNFVKRGLMLL